MTLIARAKRLAGPAASCVQAGIRIDHLTAGLSRGELLALVHVLAAGADPARLRAVTEMPGDTLAAADREALLRQARREAHRLRKADVDVPFGIQVLEAEYFREAKRRQRRPPERRGHLCRLTRPGALRLGTCTGSWTVSPGSTPKLRDPNWC